MGAIKTTTLLDLAQNFGRYMFGCYAIPISPIAKGFTTDASGIMYWHILDVQEDGTYPCVSLCGNYEHNIDQDIIVTIHHINNK